MRGFFQLLKRFRSDESGVFMVLFGVIAVVLIAAAGAVVDFASIEQARTRAQQALDSAALGLQPTIFDAGVTAATLKPKAAQVLSERLSDPRYVTNVDNVVINTTDGTLRLEGSIRVPTAFVALIGFPNVTARLKSEATRKRLNLEVAMVLDNSWSMNSSSRMTNLKLAARCAYNILWNNITECSTATLNSSDNIAPVAPNTKIGIVPFTEFVNVGPANRTASWMDQTGVTSISNDNFDSDDNDATPYTAAVNRFARYDAMPNVTWRGCVEARKYPYDTNDTVPNALVPDTLFTPEFAPDEPSGYGNSYLEDRPAACTNKDDGTWVRTRVKTNCTQNGNNNPNNYNNCSSTATQTITQTDQNGVSVTPVAATEPAAVNGKVKVCSESYSSTSSGSGSNRRYTNTYRYSCSYSFTDRVLQERLCKYTGNIDTSKPGPNSDCPTNPLTPLTTNKTTVKNGIAAMAPQTYTNIHQGAIWGFHMLSPTAPLTEAIPYDTSTVKVMIIMTDGENTVQGYDASNMNKADGYLAYGYPGSPNWGYNGRIYSTTNPQPSSDAQVTEAMDSRLVETCTNAKAAPAGIIIYTIGLSAPNQKTIDVLEDCATSAAHSYFPTNSSELVSVFKEIADQLSNLRLSQ